MKYTSLIAFSLILSIAFINESHAQYFGKFKNHELAARETIDSIFLITRSGEKVAGAEITFTPHKRNESFYLKDEWIAIDGKRFMRTDVVAFQTNRYYLARLHDELNSSLPDFVTRIKAGRLELFYFDYTEAQGKYFNTYHRYAFRKNKGIVQKLTKKAFSEAISDNAEALALLEKLVPGKNVLRFKEKKNLENLKAIVDLYNK